MIGEEIRRRRRQLGLTGTELAVRAGMAPSAVSQIETGKRTPSSASVIKLAAGLGVEVGDLYPKGQPRLPETLAAEDVLAQAGVKTRWGAISDEDWNARLDEVSTEQAMQLYEEVEAERLATLELRHQIAREGTLAEKTLAARMWERYLVRAVRAAQAAGNELVIEHAFEGARQELVGSAST
jgi:transcriptional regulator with XRE-family HTH domain